MRTSLVLAFALLGMLSGPAGADEGFRCKSGRLVSVGDAMKDVRDRCGDPDEAFTRTEKRKIKHKYTRRIGNVEESVVEEQEVEVPLDEWTYDLGPRSFTRYVTFENGRVIQVATGDYGRR
jgi:hypothetical protein